ncbi:MAG: hypothetical protein ACPL5I_08770 [Thermodesulfobacteriota bacterium]
MKKHRREKKMFKIYRQFSAKGGRLKYFCQFVGQAFMACQIRQRSSPCPILYAASFHGKSTVS